MTLTVSLVSTVEHEYNTDIGLRGFKPCSKLTSPFLLKKYAQNEENSLIHVVSNMKFYYS